MALSDLVNIFGSFLFPILRPQNFDFSTRFFLDFFHLSPKSTELSTMTQMSDFFDFAGFQA
jgi:hypothetical protein